VRSESSTSFSLTGAKLPGNESSRERKYQGAKVPCMELSRLYVGTKVPVTMMFNLDLKCGRVRRGVLDDLSPVSLNASKRVIILAFYFLLRTFEGA